jgi:hypothetical protein
MFERENSEISICVTGNRERGWTYENEPCTRESIGDRCEERRGVSTLTCLWSPGRRGLFAVLGWLQGVLEMVLAVDDHACDRAEIVGCVGVEDVRAEDRIGAAGA